MGLGRRINRNKQRSAQRWMSTAEIINNPQQTTSQLDPHNCNNSHRVSIHRYWIITRKKCRLVRMLMSGERRRGWSRRSKRKGINIRSLWRIMNVIMNLRRRMPGSIKGKRDPNPDNKPTNPPCPNNAPNPHLSLPNSQPPPTPPPAWASTYNKTSRCSNKPSWPASARWASPKPQNPTPSNPLIIAPNNQSTKSTKSLPTSSNPTCSMSHSMAIRWLSCRKSKGIRTIRGDDSYSNIINLCYLSIIHFIHKIVIYVNFYKKFIN